MRSPYDDLSSRLAIQREEQTYRRRRAVRQFAHRLRAAGLVGAFFVLLLILVVALLRWRFDMASLQYASMGLFIVGWIYLAVMPLLFALRTGLPAYVLQEHWVWLAAWFGLPIDYFILRFNAGGWRWIPILFFALLMVGRFLRAWRERRFDLEIDTEQVLWEHLLSLGVLDLLLVGYWNMRSEHRNLSAS